MSTTEMWKELHSHALNDYVDARSTMLWLNVWSAKIPRYTRGCSCNEHWRKLIKTLPPDYSSKHAFFEWTVKAHNEVNIKLNKPLVTINAAREMYKKK